MSASHQPRKLPRRGEALKHLFIIGILVIELLPIYMMIQISVKDNQIFIANPWGISPPSQWQWQNFVFAFKLIVPFVANTVFVATLTTAAGLFFALLGAYFFARYQMPLGRTLWAVFLLLMLLPGVANIVPLFALLKQMHLLNTLWALIIVGMSGMQVFAIYVLRNFIEDIPQSLFEAAEMDGASHFRQLMNIVIPLSGPIIGTLAILKFLSAWNDFLMPLIVLRDPELFTIGVGLIYLDGQYNKEWGQVMAAFLVASLPLIITFLLTMRLFVRGLSSGAVKG